MKKILFTGMRLIDGNGNAPFENAQMLVEKGIIIKIGSIKTKDKDRLWHGSGNVAELSRKRDAGNVTHGAVRHETYGYYCKRHKNRFGTA